MPRRANKYITSKFWWNANLGVRIIQRKFARNTSKSYEKFEGSFMPLLYHGAAQETKEN